MEEVILARHAESESSVRGNVNGDPTVIVRLTAAGVEQAARLGRLLADEAIDLCVTSEFGRTGETADVALAGRAVPRLVVRELNDIRFGAFEGGSLEAYRGWARSRGPLDAPPGEGESRAETVRRYARGYRIVLERPERRVLVVAHGLPIRYVLNAVEGRAPAPAADAVGYAEPHRLGAAELRGAVERLERWLEAPVW